MNYEFCMEPVYMALGILIPSQNYSKEIAMKFNMVKKIWRDVDDDVDVGRTVKPSIIQLAIFSLLIGIIAWYFAMMNIGNLSLICENTNSMRSLRFK